MSAKDVDVKSFLAELEAEHTAVGSSPKAFQEAYRLGRLDRATRSSNPMLRSGDSAVVGSADLMHRRTRDFYNNGPLIKRATDVFRDLVVGSGINSFADPIDHTFGWNFKARPEEEIWSVFDYSIESDESFIEWASDPDQCDVQGEQSVWDMQSMSISENMLTGSILILEVDRRGPGSKVPFQLQAIEREQIDTSKDQDGGQGKNKIVGGFEFDQRGREVGCWIHDVHPGDVYTFGRYSSTFVPAERYHHIFKKNRPSQNLGATWLHATGYPTFDREKLTEAELRKAIKHSLHVLAYHLENPGTAEIGMEDELSSTGNEVALGSSPLAAKLKTNEKIELLESNSPNPDIGRFFNTIDHDTAGSVNLSYYSLTGRFDETNYGGFRGAMNLEDAQLMIVQNWLGRKLVLPIRRKWNRLMAAVGGFQTVSPAAYLKEFSRYNRFDVIGPGRQLLDPESETKADSAEVRAGFATLKKIAARRGESWLKILRQIYLENMMTEFLGISLDHGAGGGGSASRAAGESSTTSRTDSKKSRVGTNGK